MEPNSILGLVLVGGKSQRMGQAKAYLVHDQKPQWQVCQEILKPFFEKVYFSTSKNLTPPLDAEHLIEDMVEPCGPLGGIISAFKFRPQSAFFVLACDMPHFKEEAVKNLLLERDPQKKGTVFYKNGVEPLCAIYEPSIFNDLLHAHSHGIYCPKKILENLDIKKLSPKNEQWLTNINYEHELLGLKTKEIKVHYYASLREKTKKSVEILRTDARNLSHLYFELKHKYGFQFDLNNLRFAKNNQLVSAVSELEDQDDVIFIPPVSGG